MKTRILAPILVASLGLGVLVACSSSDTSEVATPTSVQLPDVTTSIAPPDTSTSTVPVTTIPSTTIPVTTTAPVSPSTTAPKRQVTTTVPTAPKTKTPTVTGTPSEILDKLRADVLAMERQIMSSGDFGSYSSRVEALSTKYSGSAILVRNRAMSGDSYTAKSGDLTQVWSVELIDAELILADR